MPAIFSKKHLVPYFLILAAFLVLVAGTSFLQASQEARYCVFRPFIMTWSFFLMLVISIQSQPQAEQPEADFTSRL
jgi:hypothetical protein